MERMTARLEETPPVRDFATAIGEWLLARRFGTITPLAFRWHLWESYEDPEHIPPHVVIDLLVNDPPPPSPEWLALSREEQDARPIREWAQQGCWPFADMRALEDGALEYADALGVPDALDTALPVEVEPFGRTQAKEMRMRFTHMASEAATR